MVARRLPFLDWCLLDIGMATQSTLATWSRHLEGGNQGGLPSATGASIIDECQKHIDATFSAERFCGNGSLMRVAPIGLAFHHTGIESATRAARMSSRPTHPHPRCQEACALYTLLVVLALQGSEKGKMAGELAGMAMEDPVLRARFTSYKSTEDWIQQPESRIRSTGYVVDTLEAALWAFFSTTSFEDGAIRAVNLGDDADTVGAIYGGLAGAFYGEDAIPQSWLGGMKALELVTSAADGLTQLSTGPVT